MILQGTLEYKETEFNFTLEKNILQLVPKEKSEQSFKQNFRAQLGDGAYTEKKNQLEGDYLVGRRLEDFRKIIFIPRVRDFQSDFFGNILYIQIQYVIYLDMDKPISRISIGSKELNAIYDIRKSIEKKCLDEKGGAEVKLRPFEETKIQKFKFKKEDKNIEGDINISKTLYNKITTYPVKIRSELCLYFDSTDSYMFVVELYEIIKKFIQFLCYRKNVDIREVKLQFKNKDGKYEKIGTMEVIDNNVISEDDKIIENRFISYDYIQGYEGNILQRISDEDLYMKHIPTTYKDGLEENEATFVMLTAAFEWEFRRMYKEIAHSIGTKEAQKNASKEIEKLKDKSSGKEKKIYKKLLKFISLEGLSEKLEYCCKELDEIILPFGENLYRINGEILHYREMGNRLAKQRNNFAHGNIDQEFIGLSLLDLIFLKRIVYAMQLKQIGVSNENIKKSINKLFNAGINLK